MKNYYDILFIPNNASQNDIKKAFRTLAKEYHPDLNNSADATRLFIEVEEAYSCLSDPQLRARYDRLLRGGGSNRRKSSHKADRKARSRYSTRADKEYVQRKAQAAREKANHRAQMNYKRYRAEHEPNLIQLIFIRGGIGCAMFLLIPIGAAILLFLTSLFIDDFMTIALIALFGTLGLFLLGAWYSSSIDAFFVKKAQNRRKRRADKDGR